VKISAFKWLQNQSGLYLTGQVVAAYDQVRLTPQDFACLRVAASAKAGAPGIWAFLSSLEENDFFNIVRTHKGT
jgi:hypothetical protein